MIKKLADEPVRVIVESQWTPDTLKEHMTAMVAHAKEYAAQAQGFSQAAANDAKTAQSAVNAAANEWRGTLNDFKTTLGETMVTRPEFNALSSALAEFKLEVSTRSSQATGEKLAAREGKESSMATLALIASVAGTIAGIVASIALAVLRGSGKA